MRTRLSIIVVAIMCAGCGSMKFSAGADGVKLETGSFDGLFYGRNKTPDSANTIIDTRREGNRLPPPDGWDIIGEGPDGGNRPGRPAPPATTE